MTDYLSIWLGTLLASGLLLVVAGVRRVGKSQKRQNILVAQGVVTVCAVIGSALVLAFMRVLENSIGHGWGAEGWLQVVALCNGPSLFLWLAFEIYYRQIEP